MKYVIEQIKTPEDFTPEVVNFLANEIPNVSKLFGDKFDYLNINYELLAKNKILLICRRNGELRGILLAFLGKSPFDPNLIILRQQLLYVKPDSGRTTYHLFKKFIDIGKREANHIITMLTSQTNIKPATLERMGFDELETLYRLEV